MSEQTGQAAARRVVICNKKGLHARAAAKFVKTVAAHDAAVLVRRGESEVPGSSMLGLMMLAAGPGCELELAAEGPQAEAVLAALADLVARRFDED
ncbi:phosphocarrier protein [Tistlia consotensis]|uniref:Phosphocarrier protein n=1 Tax=Tistlia consotensis USBA 355 TaxID=560819 RepID=A0A1Y6CLH2_9PROT|nr:HPr family phosphocarrier protein [Tistlia consotensis]SMF62790.1 phosphocarrier protein [Tistlia consotensis USBA 355]SNR95117.1 phosphocarrier protein [Tistlia consotensis]